MQIERIIKEEEKELVQVKKDYAEECIIRARAAAYIAQHYPSVIRNQEECKLVASLLQVDELHFFTTDGVIYAGTHPEYYNFSFSSGEQMAFFAPMLKDHSLELCQDIVPNTAEQKLMQYAAVWSKDEKRIVQVGLNLERVLKEMEGNDVSEIFSLISTDTSSVFYAVDMQTGEILGSTVWSAVGKSADEIGLEVNGIDTELTWEYQTINSEKQYCAIKPFDSLILTEVCPDSKLHEGIFENTLLLCLYFVILFLVLILSCYMFLEKKIIRSIVNINRSLKKIEQGKWDTTLSENSTEEFAELSRYINSMIASLLDFTGKMSKSLERSQIPIGICECVPETNRFIATGRVKDILMLTDKEFDGFMEHSELFDKKIKEICTEEARLRDNIYLLPGETERFIRVEAFTYKNSKMTILTDVTAEVQERRRISRERDLDLLTGLYNRRAFYRQLNELFEKPEELKNSVMIMVDLDNLKMVNDLYGHTEGDRYLLAFSEFLHSCEFGNAIATRMGGDEFALFAYGFADEEEAKRIADKLLVYRESRPVVLEKGKAVILEFSMGWTFSPKEGMDYQGLIQLADKRMYQEKKQRKEENRGCTGIDKERKLIHKNRQNHLEFSGFGDNSSYRKESVH